MAGMAHPAVTVSAAARAILRKGDTLIFKTS
jgi:hypothetical protein